MLHRRRGLRFSACSQLFSFLQYPVPCFVYMLSRGIYASYESQYAWTHGYCNVGCIFWWLLFRYRAWCPFGIVEDVDDQDDGLSAARTSAQYACVKSKYSSIRQLTDELVRIPRNASSSSGSGSGTCFIFVPLCGLPSIRSLFPRCNVFADCLYTLPWGMICLSGCLLSTGSSYMCFPGASMVE